MSVKLPVIVTADSDIIITLTGPADRISCIVLIHNREKVTAGLPRVSKSDIHTDPQRLPPISYHIHSYHSTIRRHTRNSLGYWKSH